MKLQIIHGAPGTGKTKTLMDILVDLLSYYDISEIAYVSFTKKATEEARMRAAEAVGKSKTKLASLGFRTLHSLAYRKSMDKNRKLIMLHDYLKMAMHCDMNFTFTDSIAEHFVSTGKSDVGNDVRYIQMEQLMRSNKDLALRLTEEYDYSKLIFFCEVYSMYKNKMNLLDYTDILDRYLEQGHTENYKVAILDEAQDFTPLQWRVVLQAFKNVDEMYMAGDTDQCIFSFAGAEPTIFDNYKGEQRTLEQSYRLPKCVADEAKRLIRRIKERTDKEYKGLDKFGEFMTIPSIESAQLEKKITEGKSVYLLARTKYQLKSYAEYCSKNALPYMVMGKDELSEYDRRLILDATRDKKIWYDELDFDEDKKEYIRNLIASNRFYQRPLINIATVHAVKGGEADVVVLQKDVSRQVWETIENHKLVDSEHRVFYTGVTRAKESVYLLSAETQYSYNFFEK